MFGLGGIAAKRRRKMSKVVPLLRLDLPHRRIGDKYDFLTDDLRAATGISDTEAVSANGYDPNVTDTIAAHPGGLCIDVGAGRRDTYYENVVNYEIVDYDSTDVIGVGEQLPFKDNSFDAAFSMAVLEHVRDPFQCAREIIRILKPGGRLICCVPLLAPVHGYPHHYYNMTGQGLRALFERDLTIDDHLVVNTILPIWALTWIVQSWAAGLEGQTREQFLDLRLRDLMARSETFLEQPWVRELPVAMNFELAACTMILAHKPTRTG